MESLKEIKQKVFKTECKELLFDGLFRSEPVLTKDSNGLIDNYFVYASNRDSSVVSQPMVAFGIYSDLEKTAYINADIYNDKSIEIKNNINHSILNEEYVKEYENLYIILREMVFTECNDDGKLKLKEYLDHLYNLSGDGLWRNYLMIAPSFFRWVEEQGVEYRR